ncbi:MAG: hypothetical protein KIT25_20390 [Enhydrobacter sp.]|nr:MAG: hypothetical protein KIT25_20390 [Enhydrobacter sp.]
MSIDQDGFLSSNEIEQVRQQFRNEFPEIFGHVTAMNQLAQSIMPSIGALPRTPKNLFASAYYIRGPQDLQAAVLMAERGMFTEAYTLTRSGLETVFYLGAATRGKDFAREVGQDHVQRSRVMGRDHIAGLKAMDPNADIGELEEAVEKMMMQGVDPASLQILAVARKAELEPLYQTLYRQFSNGYAQPTLTSLGMVWDPDEEGVPKGVLWGPHRGRHDEIVATLVMVVAIYKQLIFEWLREYKTSGGLEQLHEISERYTVFLNKWQEAK